MTDSTESVPTAHSRAARRLIDVRGMLHEATCRAQVAQLAKQGREISRLSPERAEELIHQALRGVIDLSWNDFTGGPEAWQRATGEARDLIRQLHETARARADLEISKEFIDEELQELRAELEREQRRAEQRFDESVDNALILGFKDFERQFDQAIARVFEAHRPALEETQPAEALKEFGRLQEPLRELTHRILKEERDVFMKADAQMKQIGLLEKRIAKLLEHYEACEQALKTLSTSKVQADLVKKSLRDLGLLNDDKYYEKKREMLKIVLDTNKDIREKAGDLERRGITLATPRPRAFGAA